MEVETVAKQTAHEELEECRSAMVEMAAKMLSLKKEGRQRPKSELRELITQISLLFIGLRQVNRAILVEEDCVRAETESAKAPVGFATLQLHNLMYEKNHYLKAIKACKDFKWKNPDIELIPEEQFFSDAPDEIKGMMLSADSAHDLMLKRLHFELLQRKELCKHREKLEQHRSQLMEIISDRKKFLSSLPSHLKSLKKATLPVQQQLGIPHTKKLKQQHAAELLPVPLYIVYTQLLAQKEAFEEKIEMEVLGSLKEAQAFTHQQTKDGGIPSNGEHNRLEEDVPDEEDYQRRRKRSKKRPVKDEHDQAESFQSHPLKIILHIYDDDMLQPKPFKLITLRFEYLLKLNVVCVGIEGTESDDGILCNLFPDDTGIDLPHEMAKNLVGDSAVLSERNSLPYKWAQLLAGIDILPELPSSMFSDTLSDTSKGADISSGLSVYRHQNRAQTILQRLRSRKKSQMALVEQLDCLMKLKWPSLSYEKVPWAASSHLCTFIHCSQLRVTTDTPPSRSVEQDSNDLERRSVTPWDLETAREDGELPAAPSISAVAVDSITSTTKAFPVHEHSRKLSSVSKSTPASRKVKRQHSYKDKDDMELLLDSESDVEECVIDLERENSSLVADKLWKDHGSREFILIFTRKHEDETVAKLEAKVKITSEYPLRPPLFSLSMPRESPKVYNAWYNMICAMEEEVNLCIFKLVPLEWESYILAHQVQCLAMLFDFYFDVCEKRGASGTSVGFHQAADGNRPEYSRTYRGRDRRMMLPPHGSDGPLIHH